MAEIRDKQTQQMLFLRAIECDQTKPIRRLRDELELAIRGNLIAKVDDADFRYFLDEIEADWQDVDVPIIN